MKSLNLELLGNITEFLNYESILKFELTCKSHKTFSL